MANEIQYENASLTGATLYVVIWNDAGQAWTGSAFATYTTTRGDFDLAATEISGTGFWRASMVGSAGWRRWAFYLQAGGSPSHANDVKLLDATGYWDGTRLVERAVDGAGAAIAPASTALSSATWTPTIAGRIDAAVSSRAVAGDAMALTSGERSTLSDVIEAKLVNEGDATALLQAIADKFADDFSIGDLSAATFAAAVWNHALFLPGEAMYPDDAVTAGERLQWALQFIYRAANDLGGWNANASTGENSLLRAFQALFRTDVAVPASVNADLGSGAGTADSELHSQQALRGKLPANLESLGINESGHVQRVSLVDTTTANSDMRGTDNALLASGAPANFAAMGINASGHLLRVVLVDTTTTNTDMRGTDNALLSASYTAAPSAATVANAVAAQSVIAAALVLIDTNLDAKVSEAGGDSFPLDGDALANFEFVFANNGNVTTKFWDNLTAPRQITVQVGN